MQHGLNGDSFFATKFDNAREILITLGRRTRGYSTYCYALQGNFTLIGLSALIRTSNIHGYTDILEGHIIS